MVALRSQIRQLSKRVGEIETAVRFPTAVVHYSSLRRTVPSLHAFETPTNYRTTDTRWYGYHLHILPTQYSCRQSIALGPSTNGSMQAELAGLRPCEDTLKGLARSR